MPEGGERPQAGEETYYHTRPLIAEYSLEWTANNLGIPVPERQKPAVIQYLTAVTTAWNLSKNFERAAALHATDPEEQGYEYWYTPRPSEALPQAAGLEPSLEHRYARGLHIMRPLVDLLQEGFGGCITTNDFTAYELTQALAPYGLAVVEGKGAARTQPATPVQPHEKPQPLAARQRYAQSLEKRIRDTASRLGIPEEAWHNPTVQQFLGLHVYTEELLRIAQEEAPPPELQPTHGPALPQRYATTAAFTTGLLAILEEGFGGRTVTKEFLQHTFAAGVEPYNIQVVHNPDKNPYFPHPPLP